MDELDYFYKRACRVFGVYKKSSYLKANFNFMMGIKKKSEYIYCLLIFCLVMSLNSCKLLTPWKESEYTVVEITGYEVDRIQLATYVSYSFLFVNSKEVKKERVLIEQSGHYLYFAIGAKYEVRYNPENPALHHYIYFNKPIFDSSIVFGRAKAKVLQVFKIYGGQNHSRYGGLVLNYEYYINGKKYLATSCFDLEKVEHLFGDKMRHLRKGFKNNYFDVKYDVNNPALSRLVLDGVEE